MEKKHNSAFPLSIGETQLVTLLGSMYPKLSLDEFVFCLIPETDCRSAAGLDKEGRGRQQLLQVIQRLNSVSSSCAEDYPQLVPRGLIWEEEGVTIILNRRDADRVMLPYDYVARQITLTVHSSLSAVGLIAAIATHLAQRGISVNPVAGYYHDHLFVPSDRAEEALHCLQELSQQYSNQPPH